MSKDTDELERAIATERSMLKRSLSQLAQAISPAQISGSVAREVQARGGNIAPMAVDVAKANPIGALLVGAGLAALLAGPKRPVKAPAYAARSRETAQGFSGRSALTPEFDERVKVAEAREPRAPQMRASLNVGLANLPAPARDRVVKARKAALEAQEKIDQQASAAARKARSLHARQPLSTGALAIGIGGIVAALLPRTKMEDDLLGAKRDALMQQAELTLRDEIAAATETGEAALREGVAAGYQRLRQS